ncbi:hypothetical protein ACJOMT_00975 [Mycoplasmopsis synoviae]|uniref:hypothetical protein n=1 Tax=Mycoplasmopsis synoviae TaxID=2109 RepID=UPI000CA3B424|nr:hypothetical protein [Mycoplasmopsis synoviae]AKJ20972.1 Choline kinase family [Mycoplasmopsis synoviae]AQU48307.1 Choline kinase family [Mycoplasmopsis synoviae]AWL83886.1 hypothetical protein MSH_00270 [Mycoplasmopsis synoviae]QLE13616.1 hypothetical protein DEH79_00265 [Mycoplasmopsis synoviae]UZF64370.1 hypothetical protein N0B76_00265 [Mycoplasmopsis synoviae]
MELIKKGYTNISYKNDAEFVQEKILNGLNDLLNKLNFVLKFLGSNEKFVRWEFIANNKFKFNDSIIKEVANNLKQLHSSDLKFQENFMHKRLEAFLENIKKLDRLNDIVQKSWILLSNRLKKFRFKHTHS